MVLVNHRPAGNFGSYATVDHISFTRDSIRLNNRWMISNRQFPPDRGPEKIKKPDSAWSEVSG